MPVPLKAQVLLTHQSEIGLRGSIASLASHQRERIGDVQSGAQLGWEGAQESGQSGQLFIKPFLETLFQPEQLGLDWLESWNSCGASKSTEGPGQGS